jgi:hypothetical protein
VPQIMQVVTCCKTNCMGPPCWPVPIEEHPQHSCRESDEDYLKPTHCSFLTFCTCPCCRCMPLMCLLLLLLYTAATLVGAPPLIQCFEE